MSGRRITLVSDELRGIQGGGLGTVFTYLAIALARLGNTVDVLYFGQAPASIEPEWAEQYDRWGVAVHVLPRSEACVEPAHFGRLLDIDGALDAARPDVVIAQDLAGAAYVPLRRRQLGLGFDDMLFIVRCSGTRRWITDAARKVRVHPGALAVTVLERATLELADVVVAESRYMVDWMRAEGWRLPEATHVIPSVLESGATGKAPAQAQLDPGGRVRRLAFFGRLEERKGVRPFLAALNELEPHALAGVELEFIGPPTPAWPPARVGELLSSRTTAALRSIRFATNLERRQALESLAQPGTLAVMPSLEDNSPSTVYECLELGIPFIASGVGGTQELIAEDDRARVVFQPTTDGIRAALLRALTEDQLRPVQAAFDDADSVGRWNELVSTTPPRRHRSCDPPRIDVIVTATTGTGDAAASIAGLGHSRYERSRIVLVSPRASEHIGDRLTVVQTQATSVEAARTVGLNATDAPWVVFLEAGDVPQQDWLEHLGQAQAASGADVVTCGVVLPEGRQRLFLGDPGGLGAVSNAYGAVALIRRSSLPEPDGVSPAALADPDWQLLARLAASGASIVSIPFPLVARHRPPADAATNPTDALLAVNELERILPPAARSLARLAGGLAASSNEKPSRDKARSITGRLRQSLANVAPRRVRKLPNGPG